MSGVLKGIGKVFKKVGHVLKKVALPVLAIGAVVLTGGAALGLLPAVGSVLGGLGLSAGLTTALTGVVTGAGWGGLVGGITGGKKGLLKGALLGGVTGGVLSATGALGAAAAPSATGAGAATTAASSAPVVGGGGLLSSASELAQGVSAVPANLTSAIPSIASAGASAAPALAGTGGLLGGSNPYVLPSLLQGVGGALSQHEADKSLSKRERQQAEMRAANYRVNGGLLMPDYRNPNDNQRPDPADRFSPSYYDRIQPKTQYVYDEQLGQVVEKKVA